MAGKNGRVSESEGILGGNTMAGKSGKKRD
jgi:hypothetical protein